MEVYSTDDEQREALLRFSVDNGNALAIGVVLGVGALVAGVTGIIITTMP